MFPTLRRRRVPSRNEYTLLPEDSDMGSQHSVQSKPSASGFPTRPSDVHNTLCDKCWKQHRRSRAVKRCNDCKQNLCSDCAKRDALKRPWWLPACIAHCMNFFFCCIYVRHSIVDLENGEHHWALRREATNLNRLPRVSQESIVLRNRNGATQNAEFRDGRVSNSREHLLVNGRPVNRRETAGRSKSYEEMRRVVSVHPQMPKRSISVEKINNRRLIRERRQRDRIYNQNWDSDDWDQTRNGAAANFVNKVKGRDVNIVISGSEIKVTVNEDENLPNAIAKDIKGGGLRKKSKPKLPDKPYTPYTEEVFNKNPIWFKKDSGKKNHKSRPERKQSRNTRRDTCNNCKGKSGQQNASFVDQEPAEKREYAVQEPPDKCPICLDDLPGNEARVLSCSHLLHTKCLVRYIRGTDNMDFGVRCPLCNRATEIRNYYAPRDSWYKEIPVHNQV